MTTPLTRRLPVAAIAVAAALAAAMVAPASAPAKLIGGMAICGSDGCRTVTGHAARHFDGSGGLEGLQMTRPPRSGPFYKLKLTMVDDRKQPIGYFRTAWVPSAHALHAMDGPDPWFSVTPAVTRELRRFAAGHAPYPARKLAGSISADTTLPNGALLPETYTPAPAPPAASEGEGTNVVPWIAGGAAIVLLLAAGVVVMLRRRGTPWPSS
jgi:hypothetical protein